MQDDAIAALLGEGVIGEAGSGSRDDTVAPVQRIQPVAEFGFPVQPVDLMLPEDAGKNAVANDAERETVVVRGLRYRSANEPHDVPDVGGGVDPGKPLPQARAIAIDQSHQFFRVTLCNLAQHNGIVDAQGQSIHAGSIRGYTETMEVRGLPERMRQREEQITLDDVLRVYGLQGDLDR
jgi:hypothetical protein